MNIEKLLANDKLKEQKLECINSVPPRFRNDAYYTLEYSETENTINESWDCFINEIFNEMTIEERIEYNFGIKIEFLVDQRAKEIVDLMAWSRKKTAFSNDEILGALQEWMYYMTQDILDSMYQYIEEKGFKVLNEGL